MSFISSVALLSSALVAVSAAPAPKPLAARSTVPFYTPHYDTSANGFKSAARGWNSFGLQAGSDNLKHGAGWDYNDYHFRQQCDLIVPADGADYYCSIDSGWSQGCNGDANGVPTPDANVIPDIKALADHLHGRGLKLGLYVVPGAFSGDKDKTIKGTSIKIGDTFNGSDVSANCRSNFDYSKDGVQQWHDSVVATFLSWGVDMIKLDYVTPGSPDAGEDLPPDTSGTVAAYHKAIANNKAQGKFRLDISWKLDRRDPYWGIWQGSADSLRVDQDINNSGKDTLTSWGTVLRTLDFYRQFINEQTATARQGKSIMVRPDMDNTYVGNAASISGLSDAQRYTMAMHWVGAGANLITGSDETRRDDLGYMLLTDPEVYGRDGVAAFCAQYPMQPRNPSGWGTAGGNAAMQAQAWVAGPSSNGTAVVILSNYGPDPCYQNKGCTATYNLNWGGVHNVSISMDDLGLGSVSQKWNVNRVWGGGGRGGADHTSGWQVEGRIESWLDESESVMYVLTKA